MATDTTERGLETLIVDYLTGVTSAPSADTTGIAETRGGYRTGDYIEGDPRDYDRDHAVDVVQLFAFLQTTQPEVIERLNLAGEGPSRLQFLTRLRGEVAKRGVIDVLRKGVRHHQATVDCFYGTPTPGNPQAAERYAANILSVTRQLRYSKDETRLALDLALFVNGLPVATFELKNSLTKQTVDDAVRQYKQDRDPKETLFQFGRCIAHVAVDEQEVRFCTHLRGEQSWFLPFNKGANDGAGNPPNPNGLKTDYLWKELLTKASLADIIENYARIIERPGTNGRKQQSQIFPRYHQLDVVRKLLAHAKQHGAGQRYLIQHSAGSGKSNSIAWLAHQLVALQRDGQPLFDSIVVVTDRVLLDRQIRDTIKHFAQVSAIVGHAEHSGDLRQFLASGKKIVITTVQKFPWVMQEIGDEHRGSRFAIIIDEAHSSQGGSASARMNVVLAEQGEDGDPETTEDEINRIIASRKMLPNASYFAFTATPKNRTMELFGIPSGDGRHHPFHTYSMKQAIEEGFILDVLKNYTPIQSYYRLSKAVEEDPEFETRRARQKLRRYVEGNEVAIRQKAEIIVDHFHEQVWKKKKIGGQARAMVVTAGIDRAIQYFHAISAYLRETKSPHQALVAFSGEHNWHGEMVTEASLNGLPSNKIAARFVEDPYRFLVVADEFQTGYDEPLLHTMYVDKPLSGVKAVQTLSRLNRAHPAKHDTFVLDFANDTDAIEQSFALYYRTTILSEATDPNKLHDLKDSLDAARVYTAEEVDAFVARYIGGDSRETLDPLLDVSRERYVHDLDEEAQVAFKGSAKMFVRTYNFLAAILPYGYPDWEKLSIFLNFLIPRLPAPVEEDLSRGILETIDLESYRIEMRQAIKISLGDEDGTLDPVPTSAAGMRPEPELEFLSAILKTFNQQFGNIEWQERDKIERFISEELPERIAANPAYQNAIAQGDRQNARIEHDHALQSAITARVWDYTELFKHFTENPDFKRWLGDAIFNATFHQGDNTG
ncbi:MAG: type I restriction endonuclease subunit R [Thermomicrobiales bacterium]